MDEHREEKLDTELRRADVRVDHVARRVPLPRAADRPEEPHLMELTGAKVQMVERCSAIDGTWGLRAENIEMAQRVAKPLMERVRESEAELVAGDCQLANVAIDEEHRQAAGPPAAGAGARLRHRGRTRREQCEKLTVDDIVDMRAYERERDEFRRHIIELKRTGASRSARS